MYYNNFYKLSPLFRVGKGRNKSQLFKPNRINFYLLLILFPATHKIRFYNVTFRTIFTRIENSHFNLLTPYYIYPI